MLEIITSLLRTVSVISSDPALGYRGAAIKAVLDLMATAIERGGEGAARLKVLEADLKKMVAEGREPTKAEWQALRERSDSAHSLIQEWHE